MFKIKQKKSILCCEASIFQQCDFVTHAFCTRQGGFSEADYKSLNMSFCEGDEEGKVLQNWERLATALDIPLAQFLVVNQVHGDAIFVIGRWGNFFSSRSELNYDAIVTDRPNLAICVKTADCVPVLIADRTKKVIAAVHAGWRSSALGLSAKVIRLMQEKYGSRPEDILAAIGPAIGLCCYEVDAVTAMRLPPRQAASIFCLRSRQKENGCWICRKPIAGSSSPAAFRKRILKLPIFAHPAIRSSFFPIALLAA